VASHKYPLLDSCNFQITLGEAAARFDEKLRSNFKDSKKAEVTQYFKGADGSRFGVQVKRTTFATFDKPGASVEIGYRHLSLKWLDEQEATKNINYIGSGDNLSGIEPTMPNAQSQSSAVDSQAYADWGQ